MYMLKKEYERTIKTNSFHKRVDYIRIAESNSSNSISSTSSASSGAASPPKLQAQPSMSVIEETFVFHSPSVMLHFNQANMLDELGNARSSDAKRPRIVKRGIDEVVEKVEPDEKDQIDHVCFVVHGIGEGCDLKFRPLVECVDDFREIAASMIDFHLKSHIEPAGLSGRVEFIPISWHQELHRDQNGVDM
jgi:hypothetical protein